jgi:hypothetical protein
MSSGPRGFFFAAGCNAHGISGSAGLARCVAESVLTPSASHSTYLQSLSPDRFADIAKLGAGTDEWRKARIAAQRVCEMYYAPASVC